MVLTPQGALATGFFIGLAYVLGDIGIGTGLTEAYTGYNEKTLDGKTINMHPFTSLSGTPTVEIYDPSTGTSIKI